LSVVSRNVWEAGPRVLTRARDGARGDPADRSRPGGLRRAPEPEFEHTDAFPAVVNDPAASAPTADAMRTDAVGMTRVMAGIPSNHSSLFAPVVSPTLGAGVAALVTAARAWLGPNA
jgi:hypothetical protein